MSSGNQAKRSHFQVKGSKGQRSGAQAAKPIAPGVGANAAKASAISIAAPDFTRQLLRAEQPIQHLRGILAVGVRAAQAIEEIIGPARSSRAQLVDADEEKSSMRASLNTGVPTNAKDCDRAAVPQSFGKARKAEKPVPSSQMQDTQMAGTKGKRPEVFEITHPRRQPRSLTSSSG